MRLIKHWGFDGISPVYAVVESGMRSSCGEAMISKRSLRLCLIFPAMLFLLPPPTSAATQGSECSAQDLLARLKTDDPAFTDAMELAQTLRNHGFTVKCVLQSKSIGLFEGQKGAALYRTNRGDFEGSFLPKEQTFAIQPIETRKNGRYIYSFAGSPHPTGGPWDSDRPTFFIQYANQFLTAWDKQLATELDKALTSHPGR